MAEPPAECSLSPPQTNTGMLFAEVGLGGETAASNQHAFPMNFPPNGLGVPNLIQISRACGSVRFLSESANRCVYVLTRVKINTLTFSVRFCLDKFDFFNIYFLNILLQPNASRQHFSLS